MKVNIFFMSKVSSYIVKECDKYNILPSVILAQAILHSNNGQSKIFKEAKNIFEVNSNDEWKINEKPTLKIKESGKSRCSYYKKYNTYEESVKDYIMKIDKRQHSLLYENFDYENVCKNIFYKNKSSSNEYKSKLIDTIESNHLDDYDIFVTNINTLGRALDKLYKYGIIDSISYWFNSKKYINNIEEFIIKASNKIRLNNKSKVISFDDSLLKLHIKGIVNDLDYWLNLCDINSNISDLIINLASYIN